MVSDAGVARYVVRLPDLSIGTRVRQPPALAAAEVCVPQPILMSII
jgi:hypothetical protein